MWEKEITWKKYYQRNKIIPKGIESNRIGSNDFCHRSMFNIRMVFQLFRNHVQSLLSQLIQNWINHLQHNDNCNGALVLGDMNTMEWNGSENMINTKLKWKFSYYNHYLISDHNESSFALSLSRTHCSSKNNIYFLWLCSCVCAGALVWR